MDVTKRRAFPKKDLEMVAGVEGPCLYLNAYRIVGPKPWGGGKVTHKWKLTVRDIWEALPEIKAEHEALLKIASSDPSALADRGTSLYDKLTTAQTIARNAVISPIEPDHA